MTPDEKIQLVADTIIDEMFAPHEVPLDDALVKIYREVARRVLDTLDSGIAQAKPDCGALRSTLEDIIAVYEWCSVDPVDRGYSSLDSEIHRAKHLIAGPSMPSTARATPPEPRVAERLADVVMMLDTPDAYNREYIAAVCRSILSALTSTER